MPTHSNQPSARPALHPARPVVLSTAVLLGLMVLALMLGRQSLSISQIMNGLFSTQDELAHAVIWQLRLPRIVLAAAAGAALSISGAVFQQMMRNPLVSPDILGVASGAALGAVLALMLGAGLGTVGAWLVPLSAFVGGVCAVSAVMLVAHWMRGPDQILSCILVGVALSGLFAALVALAKTLADPQQQLPAITFWLLGSFANAQLLPALILMAWVLVAAALLLGLAWRIDILSLGAEQAQSMGIAVAPLRRLLLGMATLLTACTVALCGMVGWIGLVVPHMARLWVGPRAAHLIPTAALLGAIVCVAVDTLARVITPLDLAPGVLTALLGAPIFVWMLWRFRGTQ